MSVALLTEGVDRNAKNGNPYVMMDQSPSSRRAWIEIFGYAIFIALMWSPSSRRAWIEIG